jgi:hypothetical protein
MKDFFLVLLKFSNLSREFYASITCKVGPVTTAQRILRLRMEERPPDVEGSSEYIE